jgi:hypothetical protein
MEFEIEGSADEISRLQADLKREFSDRKLVFGPPKTPSPGFGSRAPLGEATLVTVVVTAVATTLTKEIMTDLYRWIKQRYAGVKVKPVS